MVGCSSWVDALPSQLPAVHSHVATCTSNAVTECDLCCLELMSSMFGLVHVLLEYLCRQEVPKHWPSVQLTAC